MTSDKGLTASQRKKLEKYLINMSKRAAYTLAISSLVLSRLGYSHKSKNKQSRVTKNACRM